MRLKIFRPALFVVQQLKRAGFEAQIVGGAVRDTLLKRNTADWDVATNANPSEIRKVFVNSFYNNDYGTVGLPMNGILEAMAKEGWKNANAENFDEVIDVTTYRYEFGYSDGRRPDQVRWGQTLAEDLSRRDFTINALALEINPEQIELTKLVNQEIEVTIVDLFSGMKDLEQQMIATVGNPGERFSEDALRMMRAIRFGAQLGFSLEPQTLVAIKNNCKLLTKISWERIRDELLKILTSNYPAEGITLLHNSGLLTYVLPELLAMRGVKQGGHHIYDVWNHSLEALRGCPSTDPVVRLATLLHDVGKPKTCRFQGPRGVTFYGHEVVGAKMAKNIGERLRLTNDEIKKLETLVRWHMFSYDKTMTDGAVRRFMRNVGLENISDMMLLRVGDRKGGGSKATSWRLNELQQRIGELMYEPLAIKDLKINGNQLMEMLNIPPGRMIGTILNQLFEEVLDDSSRNNYEYLANRAREIYEEVEG